MVDEFRKHVILRGNAQMMLVFSNQEDSVIINQASIDRGLFRSIAYKSYKDEARKYTSNTFSEFERPEKCNNTRYNAYTKLDDDGFVSPGTFLQNNDAVIGKSIIQQADIDEKTTKKDGSTIVKDHGVVDKVLISCNPDGMKTVKTRVRTIKIPEMGDKFASRSAQKATCGLILPQEDMPFTQDGITPDIIINPLCFPSRMTISQLVEGVLGKSATISGIIGDGTSFGKLTIDEISTELHKYGFQKYGFESMINGFTGKPMDTLIFITPTYYQRLKHLVSDKHFCRSRGAVSVLLHQAAEGRSKGGGLRFGQMESNCMIAHGSANLLRDRLLFSSDAYTVHVCGKCGFIATKDLCHSCKNTVNIEEVTIPYATKLLCQELMAVGIAPRLRV